ncbi:hypothetical protein JVU11DRAFT_5981 [Chiua virens]|nr:hypothetical protein JVU11DRAFT_5981 [Chiua virens]
MPFERYLRADDCPVNNHLDQSYYYQNPAHRHSYDGADCHYSPGQPSYLLENTHSEHHPSHAVQFQIPQFMLNGPPVLAPGGGAEVLPAGLLESGPNSLASSWFANNGFAPFHSSLISRQTASGSTASDNADTVAYYRTFPSTDSQRILANCTRRFPTSVDPRQRSLQEQSPSLETSGTRVPDRTSPAPSTGSCDTTSYALSNPVVPNSAPLVPPIISSLSLPVYSASGFDVLSILSRVVNRSNPTVQLGPVDLSCSFVIVDVRRYDNPIVYASPTFCHLTGYGEQEILGRNCRFLQSPIGDVAKGEPRRFVNREAVSCMRKSLSSSKECQITLINYRKGGQAFINLVTVIPLRGGVHNAPEEADEIAYHIGFQVDLTEQPNRILDKLRDGSYHCVNSGPWGSSNIASDGEIPCMSHGFDQLIQAQNMTIGPKGGRHGQMMNIAVSKELRNLIADPTFTDSVSISTGTNMHGPTGSSCGSPEQGSGKTTSLTAFVTPPNSSTSVNRMSASGNTTAGSTFISSSPSLSLLLLEFLPDFLLVLSLKGAFLYVAPSVRLVLGYEPQELVGRSISDVCHPADLVPLMRELKEGSVNGLNTGGAGEVGSSTGAASNLVPKSVDLLFRALPKASASHLSPGTQETSLEHGDFRPTTSSESPISPRTTCSKDSSNGKPPPYVWLECRGRLHVEPGKGRKAIILSGRTRWMPVVRWASVDKAGGIGSIHRRGQDLSDTPHVITGSRFNEMSSGEGTGAGSIDSLEFWALLSSQGTFLVASASVRDVLGWGTSEVIGRSIWELARDNRSGMRERVEAELAKLNAPESMVDPPPTIVTTSLVHKELQLVPARLVFYRTPRSNHHALPSPSSNGYTSTPLIHPLNNPLCPIVCQATVLSNTEYQMSKEADTVFGPTFGQARSQVRAQTHTGDDSDDSRPSVHPSDESLFEELETGRGSSWQYELQQLKFANQRLHEEVQALESACAGNKAVSGSSSITGAGHVAEVPFSQPLSSPTTAVPIPQTQLTYSPLMHSTRSTSLSTLRPPNTLHQQDPPSSDWSSLAGANGQGRNPLKRSWRSGDGPTT